MSATVNFDNLELIPKLFEKIELLELKLQGIEQVVNPKLDLTKRADVRKYLDVSESTLSKMMADGRFKEGNHFTKSLKGKSIKITFSESAIIEYKKENK